MDSIQVFSPDPIAMGMAINFDARFRIALGAHAAIRCS